MVNHMAMKFSDLIMYPVSYSYKKYKIPINYAASALSISYKKKNNVSLLVYLIVMSGNLKNHSSFAHIICPLKSFRCIESSYDVAF